MTLFPKVESWIFGANIPGKKNTVMFYMAGIGAYRQQLEAVRETTATRFRLQLKRCARPHGGGHRRRKPVPVGNPRVQDLTGVGSRDLVADGRQCRWRYVG